MNTWQEEVQEAYRLAPPYQWKFILAQFWERYLEEHPVSFGNGTLLLINWVEGDPHFEFTIKVVDSYTGEVRPLRIVERADLNLILHANPEDPRRCPVVRWFHRTLRRLYMHEADEQFLVDGKHIFDPHNPETRLSDQSLY